MQFTASNLISYLQKYARYTDDDLEGKSNEELLQLVNNTEDLQAKSTSL